MAGEIAFPLVFKATSGAENCGELPTAFELSWLAAAMRVIPGFVSRLLRTTDSLPKSAQVIYDLPGVRAGQQIMLRFPTGTTPTTEEMVHSPETPQNVEIYMHELEEYIQDWHWDETSHEFARQVGTFLLQFYEYLDACELTRKTTRKHESNGWCIGWLECSYGYHDTFTPAIFLGDPSFVSEFKRKVSDSNYAVKSYQATWRKLAKYVSSLGYNDS